MRTDFLAHWRHRLATAIRPGRRSPQRGPGVMRPAVIALTVITAGTVAGCAHGDKRNVVTVPGGSPEPGKAAIVHYGCGNCHTIPGVKGAHALVGPPLIHWAKRSFIAGELSNTPDNLVRWISDPKAVEPGTDMPKLGVTDQEARNIAAYLMTIR